MDISRIGFRLGEVAGSVAAAAQRGIGQRHLQPLQQKGFDGRHRRQFLHATVLVSGQYHRRLLSILSSE